MKPTRTFKLIHRTFAVVGDETDLGGVTLNGNRLDIKLTLDGQKWFENRTDAWLRDVRRVVRRLARNCNMFGISRTLPGIAAAMAGQWGIL